MPAPSGRACVIKFTIAVDISQRAWYHVDMCHPSNNEETRRTYCHKCEEVAIGFFETMCENCLATERAEYDAQRAEEEWEEDGDCYWDRVRECDSDAYADSIDRD
jgi:hypothetical protein